MMILPYCEEGDLRNKPSTNFSISKKIHSLSWIAKGLLSIHNTEKVHKDFHSGDILFVKEAAFISDLGLCQPANNEKQSAKKGIFGVLPYVAPEVLRRFQYTKAADIY